MCHSCFTRQRPRQYWVACIDKGMFGFPYASTNQEALAMVIQMLEILDQPWPQEVYLIPIGQRTFGNEIEVGDA
jgi:hypothetical protein